MGIVVTFCETTVNPNNICCVWERSHVVQQDCLPSNELWLDDIVGRCDKPLPVTLEKGTFCLWTLSFKTDSPFIRDTFTWTDLCTILDYPWTYGLFLKDYGLSLYELLFLEYFIWTMLLSFCKDNGTFTEFFFSVQDFYSTESLRTIAFL